MLPASQPQPRQPAGAAPRPARRRLRRLIALLVLLAATGGLLAWKYHVTRPEYRLARGQEAIREKDWDAVGRLVDQLASSGDADHAHLLRGEALHARELPHLALEELNRIRDEGSVRLRAAALSGRCLLELGERREAHRAFSFVLDQQPDHVDAHRGLAAVAYDLGQLDLAVEHLERVAELDPADARPHRLVGLIHKDMAQDEPAAKAYREALRRGLSGAAEGEVRLELAEVLLRLKDFPAVLQVLDAAPAPREQPEQLALRAEALHGLGRSRDAAGLLGPEGAGPTSARLSRIRGQVQLVEGKNAEAVRSLERAAGLDPADHQTHYLLGQAYAGAGRADDAKREFARVEELQKQLDRITELTREAMSRPWDSAVRVRLAELCDAMGKPKLAAMWRSAAAACAGQTP